MAEFDGRPNADHFARALKRFEDTSVWLEILEQRQEELIKIHRGGRLDGPFNEALAGVLADARPVERVSLRGVRFANVGRDSVENVRAMPSNLEAIMQAQLEDIRLLRQQLHETIESFRNVLPYAERGEFAVMMLSGRHGFADKIQQSVDLLGTFTRFYTRSCMTTIAATMQAYPKGLEWLKGSAPVDN